MIKIFQSRKKLREENERLRDEIRQLNLVKIPPIICNDRRNIITLSSKIVIPSGQKEVFTDEYIKQYLANKMVDGIKENILIDSQDDFLRCEIIYRARLKILDNSNN